MRLSVSVTGENSVRKVYRGDFKQEQFDQIDITNYHVMNEVVIDRGPSPYSVQL